MRSRWRRLPFIATLFKPISFVAGFFGMHFLQAAGPTGLWTSTPVLALT